MTKKITGWAIVATVERQDGTWYTDNITDIDDETASSVDTFLTDYIKEKNKEVKIKKHKFLYSIKIADFYYRDSAENMVNRIKDETNIKRSVIKKLSKTKYRVLLGPFNDIKKLEKEISNFISTEIEWVPINKINLKNEDKEKMIKFLEILEEDDDVQNIFTNAI